VTTLGRSERTAQPSSPAAVSQSGARQRTLPTRPRTRPTGRKSQWPPFARPLQDEVLPLFPRLPVLSLPSPCLLLLWRAS
jgi:hypothetical protein